jgi:hypothetical protein
MAKKRLVLTKKNLTAPKPIFFLSEVLSYLEKPLAVHELFCIISPKLHALGLEARKIEGGF